MESTNASMAAECLTCTLPELYVSAENFNKKVKKSNLMKIQGVSPAEAQKLLCQNLKTMLFTSGRNVTEDSQQLFSREVVKMEKPESMTELLHHHLLSSSLSSVKRLSRSQKILSLYGIPPLGHSFPYEILIHHTKTSALETKNMAQHNKTSQLFTRKPSEKFIVEDKISPYFIIDPEKQFLDLRDLEWKYYKGIVKWKKPTSDVLIHIKYKTEKRFVECRKDPGAILFPLVHKSLFIYPHSEYSKSKIFIK